MNAGLIAYHILWILDCEPWGSTALCSRSISNSSPIGDGASPKQNSVLDIVAYTGIIDEVLSVAVRGGAILGCMDPSRTVLVCETACETAVLAVRQRY